MKHTDLQIGDYVYHKGKIVKVDILTPSDLNLAVADEDGSDGALYKDIKPIPITPEILEKNGFEKCEESILYIWKFSKLQLGSISCFKTANNTWNFDIFGKYISPIKVRGDFNYVHELQHALRLCGIDKEIIL